MTGKMRARAAGAGGANGTGVKLEIGGSQLSPCDKVKVAQDMNRPCHRLRRPKWPQDVFTLLASRLTAAVGVYAEVAESRQARLEAMYATKAEFAHTLAAYRKARDAYHTACQSVQTAKARLGDAQRLYDNAFRDAYADWCARQPQSDHIDRLQAVRELALIRGVPMAQMARLLGYRAERTPHEVAEDLHRYLTGTPVYLIARERGISRQAVYDRFRHQKVSAMRSAPHTREGLNSGTRGR